MSLRRALAIVRKETLHIVRDPRTLFLVTISPAFLLFLLAYIFTFDIPQLDLAILDLDRTPLSRRYLATLTGDGDLNLAYAVGSYQEAEPLLLKGEIDAALVIPPGFAAAVQRGQPVRVQALVDGSDPFAGSQVVNSLNARSAAFVAGTSAAAQAQGQFLEIRTQAWYNAGLKSQHSMVPGLLPIVLIMPTLALALALTREKETGTLEGLMATPVSGLEYLAGKVIAYVGTGLVSVLLALLLAVLWFKVPFRGSLALYCLLAADYFLACMGVTVIVANVVKSQQTVMFIVLIVFIVPSFFLAGLITPISSDSPASWFTSFTLPSTHFIEINRTVFLKGLGLGYLERPALALLGMGLGMLTLGLLTFRKKAA